MTDITHLVENYSQDQDVDKGVEATAKILKNSFDAIHRFDYKTFIQKFNKICSDHNKKCVEDAARDPSYRSKLQLYEKENNLLGCIIEIPINNIENTYVLCTGNREYKQRLNNIPFTLWYLKKVVQNHKKIKNAHFTGLYLKNITVFA